MDANSHWGSDGRKLILNERVAKLVDKGAIDSDKS